MDQQKFRPIVEVSVFDLNDRLPHIGQLSQEFLLNLLKTSRSDLPLVGPWIVRIGKEFLFCTKLWGQKLVKESDVVVMLSDLKNFLAPKPSV